MCFDTHSNQSKTTKLFLVAANIVTQELLLYNISFFSYTNIYIDYQIKKDKKVQFSN